MFVVIAQLVNDTVIANVSESDETGVLLVILKLATVCARKHIFTLLACKHDLIFFFFAFENSRNFNSFLCLCIILYKNENRYDRYHM